MTAAPPKADPVAVWEPPEGFDEEAFLKAHWPGWEFSSNRLAAFRREVQHFNERIGRPRTDAYQGGVRLKIYVPQFLVFEDDWDRCLGDVVDVPAVRRLVADLRASHDVIVKQYSAIPEAHLSDASSRVLASGRLWVEAFPTSLPRLQALLKKHSDCLLPNDHGSNGSISILRAGAVSKVHTGQFNVRLRLHYPLVVPPSGPELAGAERSYGNAWSKGVFLIDDAQLHAVRNTAREGDRSIVLCDIRRTDLPVLSQ